MVRSRETGLWFFLGSYYQMCRIIHPLVETVRRF